MEACGDSPEDGYTADYVPAVSTSLDVAYDTDLMTGTDTDFIDSNFTMDCGLYIGELSPAVAMPACTHVHTRVRLCRKTVTINIILGVRPAVLNSLCTVVR